MKRDRVIASETLGATRGSVRVRGMADDQQSVRRVARGRRWGHRLRGVGNTPRPPTQPGWTAHTRRASELVGILGLSNRRDHFYPPGYSVGSDREIGARERHSTVVRLRCSVYGQHLGRHSVDGAARVAPVGEALPADGGQCGLPGAGVRRRRLTRGPSVVGDTGQAWLL
jgi:hypothetical protein